MKYLPLVLLGIGLSVGSWILPVTVHAQDFSGVAYNIVVADPEIQAGDIVVLEPEGIKRSHTEYATTMIGVAVGNKATISLYQTGDNTRPIVKNGQVQVKVTAKNGGINIGDAITTSDIPGVGQKASQSGYIIGFATTPFAQGVSLPNQSQEQGTINVDISIHFRASRTEDLGNSFVRVFRAFTEGIEQDAGAGKISSIIRYFLAAIIAIVSFAVAFFFFGRNVRASIEAVGRNPLAKSSIMFSLVLNLVFTIAAVLVGLVITFMVIRF